MLYSKNKIRVKFFPYLVLDVDGFTTRLEERKSTVENVGIYKGCDLVVDQLDSYLFVQLLLKEVRVAIFENMFYFNADCQHDHGHDESGKKTLVFHERLLILCENFLD